MGRGGREAIIVDDALAANAASSGQRLLTATRLKQLTEFGKHNSLIIDMDDTLISNQVHFDQAQQALVNVYQQLDPLHRDKQVISDIHDQVDNNLIPELGYTPERWFTSAKRTGELLKGAALTEGEQKEIHQAADLAMSTGELLPGVKETLDACKKSRVPMILKTKGCLDKQQEKLARHQFANWFSSRIWIVDRKDTNSFLAAQQKFNLLNPISIGDSYRSDVEPAIEAGFQAVLLDRGAAAWSYEAARGNKDKEKVPSATSIAEAIEFVLTDSRKSVVK